MLCPLSYEGVMISTCHMAGSSLRSWWSRGTPSTHRQLATVHPSLFTDGYTR